MPEGFVSLSIMAAHTELAPVWPPRCRDPFDRILFAQARFKILAPVIADKALTSCDVELLDARS